jgi:hypothetical protein
MGSENCLLLDSRDAPELDIAGPVGLLGVDHGDVGPERRYGCELLSGEWAEDRSYRCRDLLQPGASIASQDAEGQPRRTGHVAKREASMAVLLEVQGPRPVILDCVAEPMKASDARVAAPGEDQPPGTTHADHLVIDEIWGETYQREIPAPLTDDFLAGGETAAHDGRSAELARYKLGRISADDADGFHRVACPAVLGKVRCPKRTESMALSYERPEILSAPKDPPTCCTQKTLTVPPSVNAKTRQKHDYPSQAHRLSYGRRSAAERSNATVKDPASNDVARGWCRLMGLTSMTLMLTCLFVVRNQRVLASFEARVAEDQRRQAVGLAPRTRRRRRQTITDLVAASPAPP